MFGLPHFLSARTFSNIQTLDFSSVQLEAFELSQLCEFCSRNTGLTSLNLSDKASWQITEEKSFNLSNTDICPVGSQSALLGSLHCLHGRSTPL